MNYLLAETRRFTLWFFRDRQTLFWNIVFFVLLQVVLCAGLATETSVVVVLSIGVMGLTLLSGGLYGVGVTLAGLRGDGVLVPYGMGPPRRRAVLGGYLLARGGLLVVACLVELAVATWMFGASAPLHPLTFVVVLTLGAMTSVGLGLVVAALARARHTANAIANALFIPLVIVGGMAFPSEALPEAMQAAARPLPSGAMARGLTAVWGEAAAFADVGFVLLVLAGWAVACLALAGRSFRWFPD